METETNTQREERQTRRAYWLDQAETWFTRALNARHDGRTVLAAAYTTNGHTAMAMAALNKPVPSC